MKFYYNIALLILMLWLIFGCGAKLENETVYRVEGEATVRVVVGVDVTACEGLNQEDKAQCVKDLTDLAKIIAQTQSDSDALPMIP